MDAISTFRLFAHDPSTSRERVANQPEIAREVENYSEVIGSIKSIDDLMNNHRAYSFVMQAYGLEEMTYARAFVRQVLEGGVDDPESMANRLADKRYFEMAKDFNFERYGTATTAFERTTTGAIDKFYQQKLESQAGDQNSGARLAIYFQRKAEGVEDAYSILADRALLKFVQVTYGLPVEMSYSSLDRQAEMINKRLDFEDLKDPEFAERMVNRFLASWDSQNPDTVNVPPLISSPNSILGISQDLLATIQTLKYRAR